MWHEIESPAVTGIAKRSLLRLAFKQSSLRWCNNIGCTCSKRRIPIKTPETLPPISQLRLTSQGTETLQLLALGSVSLFHFVRLQSSFHLRSTPFSLADRLDRHGAMENEGYTTWCMNCKSVGSSCYSGVMKCEGCAVQCMIRKSVGSP